MTRIHDRHEVLIELEATASECVELLRYNENHFDLSRLSATTLPLADEPFVQSWRDYASEVSRAGSIEPLARYIVQLRFAVDQGISTCAHYVASTRNGDGFDASHKMHLPLRTPNLCTLNIAHTIAGGIPVIVAPDRHDFVLLVQALAKRNEPVDVPSTMGAVMISGLMNWNRYFQAKGNTRCEREANGVHEPGAAFPILACLPIALSCSAPAVIAALQDPRCK